MSGHRASGSGQRATVMDRVLRLFTDVRSGESGTALLLTLNVFLILTAYYLVRVLREPLLPREGRAELASYSAAGQAILLLVLAPAYGALAARLPRRRLINYVTAFFVVCLGVFFVLARAGVTIGIPFYIWVGIFSLMIIAQFWSFANDVYTTDEGKRLFPIVAFGASSGAVFGAWVARPLREGVGIYPMFLFAAALLIVAAVITNLVDARERRRTEAAVPDVMTSGTLPAATPQLRAATGEFKAAGADYRTARGTLKAVTREDLERLRAGQEPASEPRRGAFGLVFTNQYLLLVAFMILLLNWVNSNGGYLLNRMLRGASAEEVVAFNSGYLTTINLLGMFLQLFVVSRVIKHAGVRLALMVLPVIALAGNSIMAIMPMLAAVRWAKTFENATDYSLMNTLRHVLFLPTTREEKYAAKQVIDSFMVRLGDVLSAGLVALGTSVVVLSTRQFAMINVVLVLAWLVLAWAVGRRYERLSAVTA